MSDVNDDHNMSSDGSDSSGQEMKEHKGGNVLPVGKLMQENDSEMSSDSDEIYESKYDMFNQEMYLFIFDKDLKFSKRKGFSFNTDITVNDYSKMKQINRSFLIDELETLKRETVNPEKDDIAAVLSKVNSKAFIL